MKKNLGRDSDARLLWQDELNPRVRCAFGNVSFFDAKDIYIGFLNRKSLFLNV